MRWCMYVNCCWCVHTTVGCLYCLVPEVERYFEDLRIFPHDPGLLKCIAVLVMACFQVLARGNVFRDIYYMSFISEQTTAATFHSFCGQISREMYGEHNHLPTGDYQKKVVNEYDRLCFTGAVGSTDVTHFAWGTCPYNQARFYTGKEGYPTVANQVIVDHTERAVAETRGFKGSTNDKTIIRFDSVMTRIRTDPIYSERECKLYNADGTRYEQRGCHLLVGNGHRKVIR